MDSPLIAIGCRQIVHDLLIDFMYRFIAAFCLYKVILLLQAAGLRGRCGHSALARVVLEHRRDTASVPGWFSEALLVTVFLPSNGCVTPMIVQVS